MKNLNTQKGITLIALIITIIVLLILAVVAIGAVQNDGIIQYAKNSRNEYQGAQTNEQTILGNYLAKLEENNLNKEEATKPTSITISGPNSVEVRREITLDVYNQENQKVNPEDIEWTLVWEYQDEFPDQCVASVNNGIVKGVDVSHNDIGTTVTVTATYIPDDTIVATKRIFVCPLTCEECAGTGEEGYYTCPVCGGHSESAPEEQVETYYMCCESCGFLDFTPSREKCPSCGNEGSDYLWCGPGQSTFNFPCGDSSLEDEGSNFFTSTGVCESCDGHREFSV